MSGPGTFLLGVDGLPCSMWRDFAERGIMPNSRALLESGTLIPMQSAMPEVSSAAWASIVTGENPGGHNVFGFTDLIDNSYTLAFTSSRTVRAQPFWQRPDTGPHLIMNVPQTYPAQPLNGVMASGFVALDLKRAIFPEEQLPLFENVNYSVDADMSLIETSKDAFVAGLRDCLTARCTALHQLWDTQDWASIMFVITGTDRLNHYLWEDYADESSPYHQMFLDFYTQVDEEIGRIVDRLDDNVTLIAVSDHGFGPQKMSVNVNAILHEHGYLHLEETERPSYLNMLPETRAFAMDPGRVYLHRSDRYPKGSVSDADAKQLINELIDLFSSYEVHGQKIVDGIEFGQDIYSGEFAHRASDLVLMSTNNVALSGRLNVSELIESTPINGKHTFENSTFFCRSAEPVSLPKTMRVQDVLSVIDQANQGTGLIPPALRSGNTDSQSRAA